MIILYLAVPFKFKQIKFSDASGKTSTSILILINTFRIKTKTTEIFKLIWLGDSSSMFCSFIFIAINLKYNLH